MSCKTRLSRRTYAVVMRCNTEDRLLGPDLLAYHKRPTNPMQFGYVLVGHKDALILLPLILSRHSSGRQLLQKLQRPPLHHMVLMPCFVAFLEHLTLFMYVTILYCGLCKALERSRANTKGYPVFSKKYIIHVLRLLHAMVDSHQPRSSQVGHDGAEFVGSKLFITARVLFLKRIKLCSLFYLINIL